VLRSEARVYILVNARVPGSPAIIWDELRELGPGNDVAFFALAAGAMEVISLPCTKHFDLLDIKGKPVLRTEGAVRDVVTAGWRPAPKNAPNFAIGHEALTAVRWELASQGAGAEPSNKKQEKRDGEGSH